MMDGYGMMGRGFGWMAAFGWLGMALVWVIPLGLSSLVILGVASLVKNLSGSGKPAVPPQTCPTCSKPVQADWNNCPYCGQGLS